VVSGAATAQLSDVFYVSRDYRFAAIFPVKPEFSDITYNNSSGDAFPARRFLSDRDGNRHSVTIVDVSSGFPIDLNLVEHAAEDLRQRGEVRFETDDEYSPNIPGRQFNIFEADGRQLRASVYMWDHRLYITEAEGAPGATSLLQFEQSFSILKADGTVIDVAF